MPTKNRLLVLASLAACEAGLPEEAATPVARAPARESAPDGGVEALPSRPAVAASPSRPGVALQPERPPMTWGTDELDAAA